MYESAPQIWLAASGLVLFVKEEVVSGIPPVTSLLLPRHPRPSPQPPLPTCYTGAPYLSVVRLVWGPTSWKVKQSGAASKLDGGSPFWMRSEPTITVVKIMSAFAGFELLADPFPCWKGLKKLNSCAGNAAIPSSKAIDRIPRFSPSRKSSAYVSG